MELTGEEQKLKADYMREHRIGHLLDDMLHKLLLHEPENPKEFLRVQFFDGSPQHSPTIRLGEPQHPMRRRSSLRPSGGAPADNGRGGTRRSVRILTDNTQSKDEDDEGFVAPVSPTANPRGRAYDRQRRRSTYLDLYYRRNTGMDVGEERSSFTCSHIACVAVAISLFLDAKRCEELGYNEASAQTEGLSKVEREFFPWTVSLEDIFFSLRLPLHYLRNSKMTLSELYDITSDFLKTDFRLSGISAATLRHFDVHRVKHKEGDEETVAEQSDYLISAGAMRSKLVEEVTANDVVRIFSYEVTEEVQRAAMADWQQGAGEGSPRADRLDMKPTTASDMFSPGGINGTASSDKTIGGGLGGAVFSLVQSVNNVNHTATMAEVVLTDASSVIIPHEVRIRALHRALTLRESYGQRPRGYIEIAHKKEVNESDDVDLCITPTLLRGCGEFGVDLGYVAREVSSHLIAVSFAMHLLHGEARGGVCHGVDIGDVVRTLGLPLHLVCDSSMTLMAVRDYAAEYMSLRPEFSRYKVTQKSLTEKSVLATDFSRALQSMSLNNTDFTAPKTVLVLHFDPSAAFGVSGGDSSHWGIVVGYNAKGGKILIADTKPKKYQRTWVVSANVMFEAMVGKGFLTFHMTESHDNLDTPSESHIHRHSQVGILNRLRSDVSRGLFVQHYNPVVQSFEYPMTAYSITALGIALTRLGFSQASVTHIATHTDFDMNYLLSDHLTMPDLYRVAVNYIQRCCANEVRVTMTFLETNVHGDSVTLEEFVEDMKRHAESDEHGRSITMLNFSPHLFSLSNEAFGGYYGMISEISGTGAVICDCNPQAYYRAWRVRWPDLYNACCDTNELNGRARGYLRFQKISRAEAPAHAILGRGFNIATSRTTHPFKPPVSVHIRAVAFALCELGIPVSMEDVFYDTFHALESGEANAMASSRVSNARGNGDGGDPTSQTHPWKTAKFKFHMLKNTLDVRVSVAIANEFLNIHRQSGAGSARAAQVPVGVDTTLDEIRDIVSAAVKRTAGYVLLAVYDGKTAHSLTRSTVGVALVQDYNADTKEVLLADANPTKYGATWSVGLSQLLEATALTEQGGTGFFRIGEWY
eukprot:PhM_4_TR253/c0_g1_i1/m.63734